MYYFSLAMQNLSLDVKHVIIQKHNTHTDCCYAVICIIRDIALHYYRDIPKNIQKYIDASDHIKKEFHKIIHQSLQNETDNIQAVHQMLLAVKDNFNERRIKVFFDIGEIPI